MENAARGPSPWQRRGLVLLLVALGLFGGLVVFRSALLSRRMGDLGVFLRAAWAIRAGEDIYVVTENDRFHYCYPPLLAILLTPLANPPDGADRTGMLPYAASAGIWFCFNVLCLGFAVHVLAQALEERSADPAVRNQARGCRRWWALRVLPMLVCLPPIGHTLMRGQVNLTVLACLAATLAALIRGRRFQAGMWLSGAICIKIIPAFLLLYPLCRRDWRCLLGCAAGLLVGLVVVPAIVLGPARTWAYHRELAEVLLLPGLGLGNDQSRAQELINATATDSQSFQVVLHNTLYLDRSTRPAQVSPSVRLTGVMAGAVLTLLVLWAAWRRRGGHEAWAAVVLFGMLILCMILLSPVCHLHYFALSLPLVMGLTAREWDGRAAQRLGIPLSLLLVLNLLANILPHLPGLEILRDAGLAMYAGLSLWMAGMVALWKQARSSAHLPEALSERRSAA